MSRSTFTPEFKRECAELVLDHGYTVRQACEAQPFAGGLTSFWPNAAPCRRRGPYHRLLRH